MKVTDRVVETCRTRTFVATTLPELLEGAERTTDTDICEEFEQWDIVIGSLPLTTSEYVFAHGWLTSAKELWEKGDINTAIYQLKQVAKRLEL